MLKGRVSTIDEEFEKGQDTPKLTKEESAEWLNMKIMNKAKDCIKYPGKDQKVTLDAVTNRVYEGLVEDWGYNNIILNAMRALKVDRTYVMGIIEILFDEDGDPIQPVKEEGGSDVKQPALAEGYSEDGRASPYYTASLMTIDEAHESLEKARTPGAKDIKKRKSRTVYSVLKDGKKHFFGKYTKPEFEHLKELHSKKPIGDVSHFEIAKAKVYDPAAVAASIGRKKYGASKMAEMAAAGRKREKKPKGKAKSRLGGGGRFAKLERKIAEGSKGKK